MVLARYDSPEGVSGWVCCAIVACAGATLSLDIQFQTEATIMLYTTTVGMQATLWRLLECSAEPRRWCKRPGPDS